jgi:putative ABC transport system ATP-binding protein
LENITKKYQVGVNEFQVLKGIHLTVCSGEMIAVMGASGSGKSTLMNIVGFLDRCTTGCYLFGGNDVSQLSDAALAHIRNQKIGFVFQSFFLLPRLTVLQNVMLPLFYRGIVSKQAKKKSIQVLESVGMNTFKNHCPNQLSGGQQQRVAIARALVGDPDIILADEPTGALDLTTGQEMMGLLRQLNQIERRTLMIVTHDAMVSRQCQRIITLCDGKTMDDGP